MSNEAAGPEAKTEKKRRWPVIIAAVVGLCVVLMVFVALFGGGGTDEGAPPVATELPTEVAADTPTQLPQPTEPPPIEAPEPTDTSAPTEPPPPTEPPEPTATPEPQPTEPPAVALRGVTDYVSSLGTFHIVGEVVNSGGQNVEFVEVVASLYDADGGLVGTEFTYTQLDIIESGGLSPFQVIAIEPPASAESYKLQVQYDTTSEQPLTVEILSHQGSVSSIGTYHVIGEVKNPHDFVVEFVEIVGTFYNATGDVVRTEFTYTSLDELGPGQASPFEIIVLDPPNDMAEYGLQTQADKQ